MEYLQKNKLDSDSYLPKNLDKDSVAASPDGKPLSELEDLPSDWIDIPGFVPGATLVLDETHIAELLITDAHTMALKIDKYLAEESVNALKHIQNMAEEDPEFKRRCLKAYETELVDHYTCDFFYNFKRKLENEPSNPESKKIPAIDHILYTLFDSHLNEKIQSSNDALPLTDRIGNINL